MQLRRIFFLMLVLIISSIISCSDATQEIVEEEITVNVKGGNVVDAQEKIRVNNGDQVKLIFNSDESLKIHLHGYDIQKDLIANEESALEFRADATGRFKITVHEEEHSYHSDHAALFESATLEKGDKFSYQIPEDMKDKTIRYHNHMSHKNYAEIIVSSDQGLGGVATVKIINHNGESYDPNPIIVKPGTLIEWEIFSDEKVRLTSGLPPKMGHEGHEGHDDHDDHDDQEERLLLILEVYP